MEFLNTDLNEYIENHSSPESDLLARLNRETWSKVLMPRMISGHLQGRVLSMLSHMIKPQFILEIGTYTGYSALCLAEGLTKGGKVFTIDINEELEDMVRKYIAEAGLEDTIVPLIGNAEEVIPELPYPFDLIFIDADKENYSRYYEMTIDQLNPGGYVIADNVLWSGKVTESEVDEETQALKDFSAMIQADPRVENVLFPIRDGLMIARKV